MHLKNGTSIELRALDVFPSGCTFRISNIHNLSDELQATAFVFYFYSPKTMDYLKRTVHHFTLNKQENSDIKKLNAVLFRFETADTDFQFQMKKLMLDYSSFITDHLQFDEIQTMESSTGRTLSANYPTDEKSWKKKYTVLIPSEMSSLPQAELALSLDCPKLWNAFLAQDFESFSLFYWKENALENSFFIHQKITHLYIGNQFCPFLFPDLKVLESILHKAETLNLIPVLVFAPLPEHLMKRLQKLLNFMEEWSQQHLCKTEIVVNDLGTVLLIRTSNYSRFRITAGVLFARRKKDPRITWNWNPQKLQKANKESSADNLTLRNHLKKEFQIERFSYECCGYPIQITGTEQVLHLPLYQTNTSGYCTLYASCRNGARWKQEELSQCSHPCEEHVFLYPENLPIIGRWNSLFGYSAQEIENPEILAELIHSGISRLVPRL